MTLKPRQKAPPLEVQTLDADVWRLADRRPQHFTMLVFYRGLHCPVCRTYIRELDTKLDEFGKRGVEVIAISCDSRERAQRSVQEWSLERLTIGYGLRIEQAREWHLFVSRSIRDGEPPEFAEPALALVSADGALYAISVQSMPFARPHFDDVLSAVDFIVSKNYPARGEA